MIFLQNKAEKAADFLANKLGAIQRRVLSMSAQEIGKNTELLKNNLVNDYRYSIIQLSKPVAKIGDAQPNTVVVTWNLQGETTLIGLADSEGKSIEMTSNSSRALKEIFTLPKPIADDFQLQQEVKNRIESITAVITSHINKLNAEVTVANRELITHIADFVSQREKMVNRTKAAEDFLNS